MSISVKVDLDKIACPICEATSPNMLFPTRLGLLFWCGACSHEEPLVQRDTDWYWLARRAEKAPAEGAA